ncbi:Rts3p Ecym_6199 [Eremothecium cymbalariae DBVPG|uniref:Uncharacterized protein n=1 Tax=Eremothecium cymbalariae (strain CBS 270.75 / DBVPG 7215 / KCTC 17166 / NRRL Y-17582) TaxID=931890 RepID=G8JVA3_ERECY|nr:hypothetical protein Ecym_6199 [Eremothecium cymbalariae DBVPG\
MDGKHRMTGSSSSSSSSRVEQRGNVDPVMDSESEDEGKKSKGDSGGGSTFKTPTTPSKAGSGSMVSLSGGMGGKKGKKRAGQEQVAVCGGAAGGPPPQTQTALGEVEHGPRRLSQEEIVDQMEKEQDAIVMRLLREIDLLREENSRLRRNMGHVLNGEPLSPTPPQSRRSSIASLRQPQLFASAGSMGSTPCSSRRSSFSQMDNLKSDLQKKRNSACSYPITLSSGACGGGGGGGGVGGQLGGKYGGFDYVDGLWSSSAQDQVPVGPGIAGTRTRRRRQSNDPATATGPRLSKLPNRAGYTVL